MKLLDNFFKNSFTDAIYKLLPILQTKPLFSDYYGNAP